MSRKRRFGARLVANGLGAAVALGAGACSNDPPPEKTYAALSELYDSKRCATCHPKHYAEWSASMHAYAAEDPVFLAMNRRGQEATHGELGSLCVNCHAPLAVRLGLTTDGSDLASVRMKAVKVDGGWQLTGSKIWTSGAHLAHFFIVLARSAALDPAHRHAGLSQFIVALDSPGIDIRPIVSMNGQHHFNQVFFDGVFVPDTMLFGREGDGCRHAQCGSHDFLTPDQ